MKANNRPNNTVAASLNEVAAVLQGATRVLAMCHINPDGDAVGSLLGLAWIMHCLPRPPKIYLACADPIPLQLQFLPGVGEIRRDVPESSWDAVVALDASDAARLGPIYTPTSYRHAPIVVLDHHVTNLHFGTLNHVDICAAATAQIVVDLADALAAPITPNAAVCLLTGLSTDTLSFRTSNMTPAVLNTAARLMAAGADLAEITQRTLYDRPLTVLRLWGLALSRMQLDGQVVWTAITQAMRTEAGLIGSSENGLTSQLINAAEAKIAAVFNETETGQVEISLRSRPGYDVAAIALRLGGGGHPQAAGCTLPGPLADAQARILPLLLAAVTDHDRMPDTDHDHMPATCEVPGTFDAK